MHAQFHDAPILKSKQPMFDRQSMKQASKYPFLLLLSPSPTGYNNKKPIVVVPSYWFKWTCDVVSSQTALFVLCFSQRNQDHVSLFEPMTWQHVSLEFSELILVMNEGFLPPS